VAYADGGDEHRRRGDVQMGWGRRASQIAADHDFGGAQWGVEPDVGRVAHGVPARVDRLRALGNAIVPQIAEIIGHAIMEIENGSQSAHKNTIDLARRSLTLKRECRL
jgi:hypothetical protein